MRENEVDFTPTRGMGGAFSIRGGMAYLATTVVPQVGTGPSIVL